MLPDKAESALSREKVRNVISAGRSATVALQCVISQHFLPSSLAGFGTTRAANTRSSASFDTPNHWSLWFCTGRCTLNQECGFARLRCSVSKSSMKANANSVSASSSAANETAARAVDTALLKRVGAWLAAAAGTTAQPLAQCADSPDRGPRFKGSALTLAATPRRDGCSGSAQEH